MNNQPGNYPEQSYAEKAGSPIENMEALQNSSH